MRIRPVPRRRIGGCRIPHAPPRASAGRLVHLLAHGSPRGFAFISSRSLGCPPHVVAHVCRRTDQSLSPRLRRPQGRLHVREVYARASVFSATAILGIGPSAARDTPSWRVPILSITLSVPTHRRSPVPRLLPLGRRREGEQICRQRPAGGIAPGPVVVPKPRGHEPTRGWSHHPAQPVGPSALRRAAIRGVLRSHRSRPRPAGSRVAKPETSCLAILVGARLAALPSPRLLARSDGPWRARPGEPARRFRR